MLPIANNVEANTGHINSIKLSYSNSTGITLSNTYAGNTNIKLQGENGITISYDSTNKVLKIQGHSDVQHIEGRVSNNVAYFDVKSNGGTVGLKNAKVNTPGYANITFSYTSNQDISIAVAYTDINYYDTINAKHSSGLNVADITAHGTNSSANIYVPKAGNSQLGVIQTSYSASGKNYAVKVDGSGNAYVVVPWVNTKQTIETDNANQIWLTGTANKTGDQTGKTDGSAYIQAGTLYENNIAAGTSLTVAGQAVATQEYVNDKLTGLIDFKGNWPSTAPSSIEKYDAWRIQTATANWNGTDHKVEVGDIVLALDDNPGSTTSKWTVIQNNIDVSGLVKSVGISTGNTALSVSSTSTPDANGNVALTVTHETSNAGTTAVDASNKNVTGTTGQQKVITGIDINSYGHVISYTAANIYSLNTAIHKVSGTSGKTNDTSATAATNPYINVHTSEVASGASAIQLSGSSASAGKAAVTVSGVPSTGVITISASYTDTNTAFHKVCSTSGNISTAASNTTDPYINVHHNTSATSGASAIQLKGSSYVSVVGTSGTVVDIKGYYSKNVISSSATGTTNASSTTNTTTFLNHVETNGSTTTFASSNKIIGSGLTSVSAANGTLTISTPAPTPQSSGLFYAVSDATVDNFVLNIGTFGDNVELAKVATCTAS